MRVFAIIMANIAVRAIVSKDFSVIIESSYKIVIIKVLLPHYL
jgi:hypothetical protein